MSKKKVDGSPRDRLLAAANELFYAEGVHTVGIDRVIERAGVAKASLYATFGSKEELIRAYLEARATARMERIEAYIARYATPREQILALFDLLGEIISEPTFRGCAFINASAEGPPGETKVAQICDGYRARHRGLIERLARAHGVADPAHVGRQLALLYDGALVGASLDRDPGAAHRARQLAELLV